MNPNPPIITDELVDAILLRIAEGESLRAICRDPEMPAISTVMMWNHDDVNDFAAKYARAKMMRAEMLVDEIIGLADGGTEDVQRDRLSVDTRKWYVGKVLKKLYGDHQIHQTQDEDGNLHALNVGLINVPPKVPTDD